ncbi:TRADD-N-associated membrane domain-containing protein [Dactylosporangium sp. CA-139066]|uniref:TRADD-N-associated membrane domain-containing protein n=1 Tax=Dactylosporangium sp. CA-139066 TaxID=3239930 RepID=UPI003D8D6FCF
MGGTATSATVVSTVGGAVVEVVAGLNFWLYSRTSAQLNSFHIRLERMQKYLLANSVCANISTDQRDMIMADLVRTIASEVPAASQESASG